MLAKNQVLQQLIPVLVATLYKEQGQGCVVKVESGQAKNPDVRSVNKFC